MFNTTIKLLDEYYQLARDKRLRGFNAGLLVEVSERLDQLVFLLEKIKYIEEQLLQSHNNRSAALFNMEAEAAQKSVDVTLMPLPYELKMPLEDRRLESLLLFELQLLTESFYHFADRVRYIVNHKSKPLPGLPTVKCTGVREVRNKLLSHPEGKDCQVFVPSFACGGPQGPVIKASRDISQKHIFPDRGLYVNAVEFSQDLQASLSIAVKSLK